MSLIFQNSSLPNRSWGTLSPLAFDHDSSSKRCWWPLYSTKVLPILCIKKIFCPWNQLLIMLLARLSGKPMHFSPEALCCCRNAFQVFAFMKRRRAFLVIFISWAIPVITTILQFIAWHLSDLLPHSSCLPVIFRFVCIWRYPLKFFTVQAYALKSLKYERARYRW